jgi:DNA modification methylase
MQYNINHANIKDWAANYNGEPFDGILCDPPYELGFMGKSWDSSGIAFDQDMWADLLKILKPGGHLLAFSGSRTYHRMAVAIEDAGFEIRDMIEWVYGSGFPKSLNIGKAVDKVQGNEREFVGMRNPHLDGGKRKSYTAGTGVDYGEYKKNEMVNGEIPEYKGSSPYEGYGTALKPAHEPCVLARKPLEKGMTVATNALKHGTGGLNIDGSRVGFDVDSEPNNRPNYRAHKITNKAFNKFSGDDRTVSKADDKSETNFNSTGRFPANLIHDGSDEVVGLFPAKAEGKDNFKHSATSIFGSKTKDDSYNGNSKSSWGSAARFFYTAKASKSERNAGLDGFEEKRESDRVKDDGVGGDNPRNRSNNARANHHPTVKPLSLTKYLANLIKPPTGGRLLVPFSGSGSEMIGALQAGWEYVEGVELTEEYIPIAEARIKHWLDKMSKEQLEML